MALFESCNSNLFKPRICVIMGALGTSRQDELTARSFNVGIFFRACNVRVNVSSWHVLGVKHTTRRRWKARMAFNNVVENVFSGGGRGDRKPGTVDGKIGRFERWQWQLNSPLILNSSTNGA